MAAHSFLWLTSSYLKNTVFLRSKFNLILVLLHEGENRFPSNHITLSWWDIDTPFLKTPLKCVVTFFWQSYSIDFPDLSACITLFIINFLEKIKEITSTKKVIKHVKGVSSCPGCVWKKPQYLTRTEWYISRTEWYYLTQTTFQSP